MASRSNKGGKSGKLIKTKAAARRIAMLNFDGVPF